MKLAFRPAEPTDAAGLVELYDRQYQGGYSACFDRYGPATPQDFWWVQSEKSVTVIELNRSLAGIAILGRADKRLLAEEVLLESLPDADAAVHQLHEWLTRRFQDEHQDALTLRCAETNAPVLSLARAFSFTFANALLVATSRAPTTGPAPTINPTPTIDPTATIDSTPRAGSRPGTGSSHPAGSMPPGYHIRRAGPPDAKHVARLHEETIGHGLRGRDLDALWRQSEVRIMLAEREKFPAGLLIAQVKDGAGRWTIGVREGHRRRGIGRALVHAAQQFFQGKHVPGVATYWGTDIAATRFIHALGIPTERTYLYFERSL